MASVEPTNGQPSVPGMWATKSSGGSRIVEVAGGALFDNYDAMFEGLNPIIAGFAARLATPP